MFGGYQYTAGINHTHHNYSWRIHGKWDFIINVLFSIFFNIWKRCNKKKKIIKKLINIFSKSSIGWLKHIKDIFNMGFVWESGTTDPKL